jgi:hypothetical protein
MRLGYIVYRTVLEYYSGDPDEDAFDMSKALSRDVIKKSVIPLVHPVRPEEVKIQFLYTSIVLFDVLIKASRPLWFTWSQKSAHCSFFPESIESRPHPRTLFL